jgi:predicted phosphodiesterase
VSEESLAWLQALPASWDATLDGVRVAVRHGTPRSDMRGIYPRYTTHGELNDFLDEAGGDVLVVGHTHIPFRMSVGKRLVVNPGALLREPGPRMAGRPILFDAAAKRFVPGPGPAGGTFGILELPSKTWTVYRASDGAEAPKLEVDLP